MPSVAASRVSTHHRVGTRALRPLVLGLVLLVAAQGCASEPESSTPQASEAPLTAYPISDYVSELQSLSQLSSNVENVLTEQCMKDQGFPAIDVPWVERSARPENWLQLNRWGPFALDAATVETLGYDASVITSLTPGPEPDTTILDQMTPTELEAWEVAWFGPPSDAVHSTDDPFPMPNGCLGVAARAVLNGRAESGRAIIGLQAAGRLLNEVNGRLEAHESPKAALESWRDCMRGSGYEVNTPEDAYQLGLDYRDTEGKAQEIELALADAACQNDSELQETMRQTIAQIEAETLQSKEGQAFAVWYLENYDAIIADVKLSADQVGITIPAE